MFCYLCGPWVRESNSFFDKYEGLSFHEVDNKFLVMEVDLKFI